MMPDYKDKFEVCARGIIQHRGKILLCRSKRKNYYFFPGGHINFGEDAKSALSRELAEELDISVKKASFVGVVENVFIEGGQKHHEIDFVFDVKIKKIKKLSKEDHIDFFLIDIGRFFQEAVLPIALKKAIVKWLKDKKVFFASQVMDKLSI